MVELGVRAGAGRGKLLLGIGDILIPLLGLFGSARQNLEDIHDEVSALLGVIEQRAWVVRFGRKVLTTEKCIKKF
jgi:hypothetical protein